MRRSTWLVLVVGLLTVSSAAAQNADGAVAQAARFQSAEAHYRFLLQRAAGGTRHTTESLPDWSGIWLGSSSSLSHPTEAPLTPDFRADYDELQRQMEDDGEVDYDRLTHCEPTGYPRWIFPTGTTREFVLTPDRAWLMLEYMNETRRVYTDGRPHSTPEGHTWLGDSIGFWDGDKLVIWTLAVKAADYSRGHPKSSDELEGIEIWQLLTVDGQPRITVDSTMYDPIGLAQPWRVSAAFDRIDSDYRIRYWECAATSTATQAPDGTTTTTRPTGSGEER